MICLYVKRILIVLLAIIILAILYNNNCNKEPFDESLTNDAIQSIASVYDDNQLKADNVVANSEFISLNKNTLGNTVINGDFSINGNLVVDGTLTVSGRINTKNIKIGGVLLSDGQDLVNNEGVQLSNIPTLTVEYDGMENITYLNKDVHATYSSKNSGSGITSYQ